MQEIWRDIPGYEGLYQVSNLGRVRSLDRKIYYIGKNQYSRYHRSQIIKGKIMNQQKNNCGYQKIMLSIGNKRKIHLVHRLVAEAFIPNLDKKIEVNHKDGNKSNNRVENLEWCSRSENMKHAINVGLRLPSELQKQKARDFVLNTKRKKVNQYDLDGKLIKSWNSMSEASRFLNLHHNHISKCCSGKQQTAYGYIWKYTD